MKYHHTNLECFKLSDELTHLIYDFTAQYPKVELFGTVSQMRRAALSVTLNIVEGNAKRSVSNKECIRFLKIALGSLIECEYLIEFSYKRQYLSTEDYKDIEDLRNKCGAKLWKYIDYLEKAM